MMKRFLLITILFSFCNTLSSAQNKQDEYNKLVDYVNCKYAVEYINGKKSKISSKGYINDFEKYKKAFINNVKSYPDIYNGIDKTIKNSTPVYDALKKTASGFPKAKDLWQFIDDKKVNFSSDWTKEQMIDYLILLSDLNKTSNKKNDFNLFLQAATNSLKNDLENQISGNLFYSKKEFEEETTTAKKKVIKQNVTAPIANLHRKVVDISTEIEQVSDSNRNERYRSRNNGKSKFPYRNIIFVIVIAALGYFGYKKWENIKYFVNRYKTNFIKKEELSDIDLKKRIKELELENQRLRSFEQENALLHVSVKQQKQKIRELERLIPGKTDPTKEKSQSIVIPEEKEKKQVKLDANRLYADAIIDGEFYRLKELPNEDTVFELILSSFSQTTAKFQIYHKSYRRVIKNPDFVDGCEKQKINSQPQNLVVENGEAAKDDYNKWKITKKAIIKFV